MSDGKPNILLVDDEDDIIETLFDIFSDTYNVLKTDDPIKALEILKDGNIAIIIADHKMPELTGIELLIKAMDITPNTIRILLTGYTELEVGLEALKTGKIHKYIEKPWDDDELLEIVDGYAKVYKESCSKN